MIFIFLGLCCGSLNLIDDPKTIIPKNIFPSDIEYGGKSFRMAILHRESFCTENLTPWIKLLPCRDEAGLAMLLDPLKIFNSIHLMLDVRIDNTKSNEIILKQRLMATYDLKKLSSRSVNWNVQDVFGRTIKRGKQITIIFRMQFIIQ